MELTHRRAVPVILGGSLLVAGCTSPSPPAPQPASPPVAAGCPSSATLDSGDSGDSDDSGQLEKEGVGEQATIWALFFSPKAVAGQEIKIAWRMTGGGDLTMTATGPDGRTITPSWGPEAHGGSSWRRPGDEWGTGWLFPTAGCWTVHATRGPASGQLTLRVA